MEMLGHRLGQATIPLLTWSVRSPSTLRALFTRQIMVGFKYGTASSLHFSWAPGLVEQAVWFIGPMPFSGMASGVSMRVAGSRSQERTSQFTLHKLIS